MQKITPNLWFNNQAEEAAQLYTSIIPNSKIVSVARYDQAAAEISGMPPGSAMTVAFELAGQSFVGLNGGPQFKFNPSISFHVKCATIEEAEEVWEKFSAGGAVLMPFGEYPFSERFGWCNDQYGVSWQIIFTGGGEIQQKITPAFLFVGDVCGEAENAIDLYTSVFHDAGTQLLTRYGKENAPEKEGTIQYAAFTLEGQEFVAMDSALEHNFAFNEAVSFIVDCLDQKEVDTFWNKLTADGGEESMCGWLKDKFGVSWQIIPRRLYELIGGEDGDSASRAVEAMLKMRKIDIAKLEEAYAG